MLNIDLVREMPEALKPRRIEIARPATGARRNGRRGAAGQLIRVPFCTERPGAPLPGAPTFFDQFAASARASRIRLTASTR